MTLPAGKALETPRLIDPSPAASIRWSCACATRWRPVTRSSPDRSCGVRCPVAEVIHTYAAMPLPDSNDHDDVLARPGGPVGPPTRWTSRRATGFAVGFKNLMYAEGYDDCSTAAVLARATARPRSRARRPRSGRGRDPGAADRRGRSSAWTR